MLLAEEMPAYGSRVRPHPVMEGKVRASLLILNRMNDAQIGVLMAIIGYLGDSERVWGLAEALTPFRELAGYDPPPMCEWPGPPPPAYTEDEDIAPAYATFYRQP